MNAGSAANTPRPIAPCYHNSTRAWLGVSIGCRRRRGALSASLWPLGPARLTQVVSRQSAMSIGLSFLTVGLAMLVCFRTISLNASQNSRIAWQRYQSAEDAGFSTEKLAQVKAFYDSTPAKAVMVVPRGGVVAAWGDVERRFKSHSIRKSLLSSLYGVYMKKGLIDINKSLGSLGIADRVELTEAEKTAKVSDLLKTRSGVYLEAALEDKKTWRPKRGSHLPGTFQYYNNWDFNVLGSIFRQETKEDIFEAFKREIADRLGMQDFRIMDGAYEYEGNSRLCCIIRNETATRPLHNCNLYSGPYLALMRT
jgi:CubicO group peptidase (beta-lactamase class C family)